jgi:hypothetical protein
MRLRFAFAAFLIAISCASSYASESPEDFLRRLYKMHFAQITYNSYWLNDKNKISKYFDDEMTALFLKDIECRDRNQGMCNLDFDPILGAQDFDERGLKQLTIQKLPDKTRVRYKVTFINLGPTTIIYDLKETPVGWRISDIIYKEGWPLKKILSASQL